MSISNKLSIDSVPYFFSNNFTLACIVIEFIEDLEERMAIGKPETKELE